MDDFKIFNTKNFYILAIEPGKISHLDWNNPDYVQTLSSMPFIKTHLIEPDKIFDHIHDLLKIDDASVLKHVITETISEEPNYIYQILFIDTLNKKHNLEKNELASMLNITGEQINGNALIIKSYVPTLSTEMLMDDMTASELTKILKKRGFTQIVVWENDEWREEEIYGDMENYAKKFFEEEYYDKMEIAFLKHNLNIWYSKSEYGTQDVFGTLIRVPIEKCLVFTMTTNAIRGCISKDEINKIIKLSTVLEPPFRPENKWFDEELDEHGRTIIKNKYRILDTIYKNNF
jgi:hypothetical protein